MARDAELERLKIRRDETVRANKAAQYELQRAWEEMEEAGTLLERKYQGKQVADTEYERVWKDYKTILSRNYSRVRHLENQISSIRKNLANAVITAANANTEGDKFSNKKYLAKRRRLEAELQRRVLEANQLNNGIHEAHEQVIAATGKARDAEREFKTHKRSFEIAKLFYQTAEVSCMRTQSAFDKATKEVETRLDTLRARNKELRSRREELAIEAGIPEQYRDSVFVSGDDDGSVNLYFGGEARPDGPGHGHYVLSPGPERTVTYKRDPYKAHGSHNYITTS